MRVGLGHGRREIAEAIGQAALQLDYAPAFQFGHPLSFELSNRLVEKLPQGLNRVFFTVSGESFCLLMMVRSSCVGDCRIG